MKYSSFLISCICLLTISILSSCSGWFGNDDIIYTPLYQFNYYLTNNIDTTVTFCFNQYDRSTGFPPSEQTVVLTPATSGKIYGLMQRSGFLKTDSTAEQPVLTPEESSTIVLWDPRKEDSTTTTTYLLIGDTKRDFDLESDKLPFYTKNYKVEIEQDTIFNFYFSIDSAFVQTLK